MPSVGQFKTSHTILPGVVQDNKSTFNMFPMLEVMVGVRYRLAISTLDDMLRRENIALLLQQILPVKSGKHKPRQTDRQTDRRKHHCSKVWNIP